MRRLLFKVTSSIALLCLVLAGLPPVQVHAASIVVNTDTEPPQPLGMILGDGLCTLREAIANANNDNAGTGDCTAGSGTDTISFAASYTITLSQGQLTVTSAIVLNGGTGWTTLRPKDCSPITLRPSAGSITPCDPATWRIVEVGSSGYLTAQKMVMEYGRCVGACPYGANLTGSDEGGAIYVNPGGTLSGDNLYLKENEAGTGGGLYNNGGTVNLTHGPMSFNKATSAGGAAYSNGGSLSISTTTFNQAISDNSATYGGGLYYYYAGGTINNVDFHDNSNDLVIGQGGAILNEGSSPTIQNSTFEVNRSVHGAGMYNLNSNPTISNTVFNANKAPNGGQGAGIFNSSSSPTLTNVVFLNNEAVESLVDPGGQGGGIYNDSSSPSLQTVMFYENHATESGGGMFNANGSAPAVSNATFAGNTADTSGGAMGNSGSNPTLTNLTFNGNTAPVGAGIYNLVGNPIVKNVILWGEITGSEMTNALSAPTIQDSVVQGGCPTGATCTNIVTTDPLLGTLPSTPAANDTMSLGFGSPAIDAGTNSGCPSTDQRGVARPQGPLCDIGAYEASYYSISGTTGTASTVLSYDSNGPKTVTADGTGYYTLSVPEHWSGTVTPSKFGYTFSPTFRTYSDIQNNAGSQNYSAPTYLIQGNAGVANAVLYYPQGDGGTLTAQAGSGGDYSITVPSHWTGAVTPGKYGCTFTPTERSYSDVLSNFTGQDYTGECAPVTQWISGNAGTAGAVVQYGPFESTTADDNGDYTFSINAPWTGTVTPSKAGCTFTPAQRSYNFLETDMPVEDYQATCSTPGYLISGSAGAAGVLLSYNTGTPQTTTSDGGGYYSLTVPAGWTGTVTPSKSGCTFTPPNKPYSNVSSNAPFENYFAVCTPAVHVISGAAGTPGAALSFNDGIPLTATAFGLGGLYQLFVSDNWSGMVTPSKLGCTFTPPNKTYSNVTTDVLSQNYAANCAAVLIWGNAGTPGATLSYANGGAQTVTADEVGDYWIPLPLHWNGTVTPSKDGCTFTPAQRSYSDVTVDQPVEDYLATCAAAPTRNDFEPDGTSDIAYFHAATGVWGVLKSSAAFSYGSPLFFSWGQSTDTIVPGDYDGDHKTDPAVRRAPANGQSSAVAALLSSTGYDFGSPLVVPAGWPGLGDTPVPGDYNGDGIDEPAIFRGNTGVWIIPLSPGFNTYQFLSWGASSDKPVGADVDGDGQTDIGYFRPSTGTWAFLLSSQAFSYGSPQFFSWGDSNSSPVMRDYDGDGKADPAYVTPPANGQSAAYRVLLSTTGYNFGQSLTVPAGWPGLGDTPVPDDYDGDGKADAGLWRGNTGVWIIPKSSTNNTSYLYAAWGASGDQVVK